MTMKRLALILIHLLGVSIISACFLKDQEPKTSDSLQRKISVWHNVCLKLFYISTWSFLLLGGILALGDGIDTTGITCTAGVVLGLVFYFMSKLLGHMLYLEKIRDSRGTDKISRTKSSIHRIYFLSLLLLFIFFIALLATSKSNLAQDMECVTTILPALTLLFYGYNMLLETSLAIVFLWPPTNEVSASEVSHKLTLMQILPASLSLVATVTNTGIIGAVSSSRRGQTFIISNSVEIVLNVVGVALLNNYTRKLSPKDTPNRSSRSLQPTFHDSLPNYYQVQGAKSYSTSSLPYLISVARPLSVTSEIPPASATGIGKLEKPPPALSKEPRSSYFNFMSSLVNLYSTRESAIGPDKPRGGRRRAPTLPEWPWESRPGNVRGSLISPNATFLATTSDAVRTSEGRI